MDDIQLVYESHEPAALTSIGLSASQVGSRIAILGRQAFFICQGSNRGTSIAGAVTVCAGTDVAAAPRGTHTLRLRAEE